MPEDSWPAGRHHQVGVERERRDDWLGAVAAFGAAAAREPGWAARHYRLGAARERVWDLAGAAEAYAAAVAIAPQHRAWSRRLAQVRRAAVDFRPYSGLVIAHRGTVRGGAENAIEGLDDLPETAAGVEVDVWLSRDGVPVLMHDARVDRTTDGHGAVAELTYAQLSTLAGRHGAGVPALADYLKACEPRGFQQILLDLKAPTLATFQAVATAVRTSAVAPRCVLLVRDEQQLRDLREVAADLRLGGLGTRLDNVAQRTAAARAYRAEVLLVAHGDQRYLTHRGAVAQIHAAGLRAGGSIVNSREALEAARQDGCDVLLTDRADQLRHYAGG